jgi:hypothetical protein
MWTSCLTSAASVFLKLPFLETMTAGGQQDFGPGIQEQPYATRVFDAFNKSTGCAYLGGEILLASRLICCLLFQKRTPKKWQV